LFIIQIILQPFAEKLAKNSSLALSIPVVILQIENKFLKKLWSRIIILGLFNFITQFRNFEVKSCFLVIFDFFLTISLV